MNCACPDKKKKKNLLCSFDNAIKQLIRKFLATDLISLTMFHSLRYVSNHNNRHQSLSR